MFGWGEWVEVVVGAGSLGRDEEGAGERGKGFSRPIWEVGVGSVGEWQPEARIRRVGSGRGW